MRMTRLALGLLVALGAACAGDDRGSTSPTVATLETTTPSTGTGAPVTSQRPVTTLGSITEDGSSGTVADATPPDATEPATVPPTTGGRSATTATTAACGDAAVGVTDLTLSAGGADHAVRVYVPSTFAGERLATVLNWHGLGSNGPQQAAYTGYEALAESEGFIVVHPTGLPDPGGRNSWELADVQDSGRDDLAFANGLIDTLIADWCADPARIYSTGLSNGGFFTSRLVCEAAGRIAAASSIAGTFHPDGCAPARAVPYLSFHGTADVVVPFAGGGQSVLLTSDDPALRALFEQVIPEEFAQFAAADGCSPEPAASPVGDDVIRYDYAGCTGDIPLAFFEISGGGHTWPNSPLADVVAGLLGYTTDDVDATVDSWAFFQQHTLDG